MLPTPRATDMNGAGHHGTGGMDLRTAATLLPTPMVGSTSPAAHGQISGDYRRRMDEALALMPTPRATDGPDFGPYASAIARWEHVLGRPAPSPTEPGKTRPRLSAAFTEWMMGLPAGHVVGVPGLFRIQRLRALGNGVVPQQAAAALRYLHTIAHQEDPHATA